jgi:hypothetical protein
LGLPRSILLTAHAIANDYCHNFEIRRNINTIEALIHVDESKDKGDLALIRDYRQCAMSPNADQEAQ